jgi:Ni,Fe-hydrogenase III small subunit/formate hydrogenlyase subunit 6/NADH:ubiquinone oxidoreductase subunit I
MLDILRARFHQGHRTSRFPDEEPRLPSRFRGRPVLDIARCAEGCRACIDSCPTQALAADAGGEGLAADTGRLALDMGRCLFCADCVDACPEGAIAFSPDFRLAERARSRLVVRSPDAPEARARELALSAELLRLYGRSLKLRVVSAGGCNGCEADVGVLGTIAFDLGRFGIQYVASPRHADGLLITGPVTANMREALRKTYEAVPDPRIVIAVGACAIAGGPYLGHAEVHDGADSTVPVDLYVPGCPPHPMTILEGLIGLLGRSGERTKRAARRGGATP